MGCSICRGHAHQVCSEPGCHDETAEVARSEAARVEAQRQSQLHLRSQRDQPYGSVRRCCNNCGVMLWGNDLRYTESEVAWATAPDRCRASGVA